MEDVCLGREAAVRCCFTAGGLGKEGMSGKNFRANYVSRDTEGYDTGTSTRQLSIPFISFPLHLHRILREDTSVSLPRDRYTLIHLYPSPNSLSCKCEEGVKKKWEGRGVEKDGEEEKGGGRGRGVCNE